MKAKIALLSLSLFVIGGCGRALVGKWTLDKDGSPLKEAKTYIKRIQFESEGSFAAEMMETLKDGQRKNVVKKGKYQFNGFQLKLSTKERDQVWNAMLIMNRTLELKREGDKFKLKRQEQ